MMKYLKMKKIELNIFLFSKHNALLIFFKNTDDYWLYGFFVFNMNEITETKKNKEMLSKYTVSGKIINY